MGTKLNKKNEKRKNEQQSMTHQLAPPPNPSPIGRGVITEIPHTYDDKAKT